MKMESSFTTSLVAGLVLACGSTAALADENSGLYLGASAGQFGLEFDDIDDEIDGFDFDDSDSAYKLFAGWRFNPFISAELAYLNLGNPSEEFENGAITGEIDTEITGFSPYIVGTLPLGFLELYARVGYLFYNIDVHVDSSDDALGEFSDSDEAFAYGVGAGFVLFERLNLRLEYERFEVSNADNADAYWLTAAWRF